MKNFKDLRLAAPVFDALTEQGYTQPTPIQAQSIPQAMSGRDIMGIAQTGTGKTAAFALPSLHYLCENPKEPPKRGARVLVLAPTRELASQIAVSFRDYGQKIDLFSVETVFGGVKIGKQIKRLVSGNDVLVATPGRLIDLLDRKAIKLSDIEILILDEADQMMDMGFIHALRKIIPLLPEKRQTMFFSATMATSIAKLAGQFLTDPVKVSVTPANTTAEKVHQRIIFVNAAEKQDLLGLSLLDPDIDRALIFTRTKHGADRVVKRLAKVGIEALAIHGNKSQPQRQRALKAFKDGEVRFMIATDIAARGIDIEGISHVFNFEIPNVAEQYVHRIGRTARAGRSGVATSFVASDEKPYLKDIQKLLKTQLEVAPLPENFVAESAKLKKRTPLAPKPKPTHTPRAKGRGKNKKRKQADKAAKWSPETSQPQPHKTRTRSNRNDVDKVVHTNNEEISIRREGAAAQKRSDRKDSNRRHSHLQSDGSYKDKAPQRSAKKAQRFKKGSGPSGSGGKAEGTSRHTNKPKRQGARNAEGHQQGASQLKQKKSYKGRKKPSKPRNPR